VRIGYVHVVPSSARFVKLPEISSLKQSVAARRRRHEAREKGTTGCRASLS
jgi:hypothetical protein